MKIYSLLLIQIIIFFVNCQMNDVKEKNISSGNVSTDPIILEIVTNAKGAVYPKEGNILHMRLFESGRFEYDDFPDYNPPKFTSRNISVVTKESKITPEEVMNLVNLAERADFLSAKENYPSLYQHTDTIWITTIKFSYRNIAKKITAINFWDVETNQESKSKYPASMVELLEKVEELKAKAIGRKSNQWIHK